ncbi:exosortase [Alteromonas mediterranea 615]|uniref:Exosortase n=2 Tax=Alteromonas mediterranea TaxID=314275 RepID=S5AIP8_9ALTE|nr:exosortase [Alteromonas mediterranea 615]
MTSTSSDTSSGFSKVTIAPSHAGYLSALLVLWIFAYYSTFERITATWFESTTFEHAVLIPPIAVWLIYRKRFAFGLARRSQLDACLGFFGLVCAVVAFIIGKLSLINALQQFALMSMPLFFILSVFGLVTLKHLLFPLVFLILSVPFGEFMIPHLQEVTADLTVIMLKLVGVPVYREGWYLQIPEGLFHVAEACSGIRFLFSTITIGLLIAHLEIESRVKQIVFMLSVLVIPILANGMRAFIMVYIGHVSNMQAAVGFDHLVYGWVFFFFVTALVILFSRLFYDGKSLPKLSDNRVSLVVPKKRLLLSALIIGLGPTLLLAYHSQQLQVLADLESGSTDSYEIEEFRQWKPIYSGYDEYRSTKAVVDEEIIILHKIAYLTENEDKELLTWSNRPYDPEKWSVADSESGQYRYANKIYHYRYLTLKNGMGKSINLIYMWKVGDNFTANPIKVKTLQLLSKLTFSDFGGVALYAATQGNVSKDSLVKALIELEQQKSE